MTTTEPAAQTPSVKIYATRNRLRRRDEWRWTFYASNGLKLANGGESYVNLTDLLDALATVLGVPTDTLIDVERWQQTGFSLQRARPDRSVLVMIRGNRR